jgi:hypothetical protein
MVEEVVRMLLHGAEPDFDTLPALAKRGFLDEVPPTQGTEQLMSQTQKILKVLGLHPCGMHLSTSVTFRLPGGRSPQTLFFRDHERRYIGFGDLAFTQQPSCWNQQTKVSKTCAQSQ